MTAQTMTPRTISYVVRRFRTVMRAVDTDAVLFGTRLGTPPLDEAVRHSGTDVVNGSVGAYSIRHGDSDIHTEAQIRYAKLKRGTYGTEEGFGLLGTVTMYNPDGTVTVNVPGRSKGGRPVGTANGKGSGNMPNRDRSYLKRQRAAAREANPNATDDQIEAVARAALEARQAREAAAKPTVAANVPTVSADVVATSSGSWADGN